MHIRSFKKVIGVAILLLLPGGLTFASEKANLNLQGVVMKVDLKHHSMVVNERLCIWNGNTALYNEKGGPASFDQLKEQGWVYIEAVQDKAHHRILAKTIYLLPKRIDEKEKHLYPFIK